MIDRFVSLGNIYDISHWLQLVRETAELGVNTRKVLQGSLISQGLEQEEHGFKRQPLLKSGDYRLAISEVGTTSTTHRDAGT